MSEQTLSFTQQVKAPAEVVYRAFTNATALREWLCDVATVSPHPGGRLYLWWTSGFYTSGSFTQAEEGKKVAFSHVQADALEGLETIVVGFIEVFDGSCGCHANYSGV